MNIFVCLLVRHQKIRVIMKLMEAAHLSESPGTSVFNK